ncbi:MAG: TraB family protein [Methanomassiliicoccales archaeon PtaU1.Bin124]|nr:MAG: TraB family protein [Methanomassiliicoccales archaeon PtaU1.Bin124]
MITLVGVGHVFDIEKQVRYLIRHSSPAAVGVELDAARYEALKNPQGEREAPLAYRLLAMTQMRIAKQFNQEVGREMLAAVDEGQKVQARVLFIDVEASDMFNKLWRRMPFKEKIMMLLSGFTGLIISKKRVETELQRFEENEEQYLQLLGQEFPTVKQVLIDDRNVVMANRILQAEQKFGSVLAVVGDGHVEGIQRILNREDLTVVRLKDLRTMEVPEECISDGNCEVTIRYNVEV